ncbi:hypothetical protein ACUXP0_002492 [Staphylococcus epidermidis]|jgi:hypothetical protein|nr:putative membrane protein [Staphylococcus epidermidis]
MKITNLLLLIAVIMGCEFLVLTLFIDLPDSVILLHSITSIIVFIILKIIHTKIYKTKR